MASPGINWLRWGEEAFALASAHQWPILLRIGASWCASCALMEQETDSDPEVVSRIEQRFVPIYVDSDRRPDINERYNLGGWPTNAFLTPRGDLITGGTYFDTQTFRMLLGRVWVNWKERRTEVDEAVAARRRDVEERQKHRPLDTLPTVAFVESIVDATMDEFDFRYGGFGREAKFPHTNSIELLLAESLRTGETRLREAALMSLEAMWDPGHGRPRLADPGGGFFRYAGERDWSAPRYEIMLDEMARIVSIYLSAHQLTGESRWAAAARAALEYVKTTLADETRGFFRASQGAGAGVDYYGLDIELRRLVDPPPVDDTVIVPWNLEMASAFLKASLVLGDEDALHIGTSVISNVFDRAIHPDADPMLGYLVGDRTVHGPLMLSSQVYGARALVDLYEATDDSSTLARAASLMDAVAARLRDTSRILYSDTIRDPGAEGYLSQPLFPLVENSVAADTLIRLAAHLDVPNYESKALDLLRGLCGSIPAYGFLAGSVGLALLRSFVPERLTIHLAGDSGTSDLRALLRAAYALYAPFKTVRYLDPERDRARYRALEARLEEGPVAVVCRGVACAEPTSDPQRVLTLVAKAASVLFTPTPLPDR